MPVRGATAGNAAGSPEISTPLTSAFTCPPLTTVSQNFDRMGDLALGLLFSMIGTGREPTPKGERILLNGELVFRASA